MSSSFLIRGRSRRFLKTDCSRKSSVFMSWLTRAFDFTFFMTQTGQLHMSEFLTTNSNTVKLGIIGYGIDRSEMSVIHRHCYLGYTFLDKLLTLLLSYFRGKTVQVNTKKLKT